MHGRRPRSRSHHRVLSLRTALVAAVAALVAACSAPPPAAPAGDVHVYRDFTLIDGSGGPGVGHSAMVTDKGRITWVGPVADLKVPLGAAVEDLAGAFVIPGLINTHGHVGNVQGFTQDSKFQTTESVEK